MKLPEVGDKVKYVEKIPQDDGAKPIIQDISAKVVAIHEGGKVACEICHDREAEHSRPERRHPFKPQENTLVLDVSFSAWGHRSAQIIRREHVEYGKLANQWHK